MMATGIELCALGQAGLRLRLAAVTVLIDPWTAPYPGRLRPPPPATFAQGVDSVLVTHEHMDHLDKEFLARVAAHSPGARVALPRLAAPFLDGIVPADRVDPLEAGDTLELPWDVHVEAVPAYHALEPEHPVCSDRFLGYLVTANGTSLYHSGDTFVTKPLLAALRGRSPDVAVLPINGRDAFREFAGIVGNMSAREAVGLCSEIGARTLVPIHWDLFEGNTERPGSVLDAVEELNASLHVLVLAHLVPLRVG